MKVHHLNCGTMCPFGGSLLGGEGGIHNEALLVAHCLLVETGKGLVLVDTGFGTEDLLHASARLGREFLTFTRPRLLADETAIAQIRALGLSPHDVRDIVVTHLDLDHAGGISDFPWATLHVTKAEHSAFTSPATFFERRRYKPVQLAKHEAIRSYEVGEGDRWFGFPSVRAIGDDVLIVPLSGHTRGHAAVAVKEGDGRWLLHAGDAYFHRAEMAEPPSCPRALATFQKVLAFDDAARVTNQARLRELVRDQPRDVRVFSAHDHVEFERFNSQ